MPTLLRQFLIWTVVCGISAAPSFMLALFEYNNASQILAMLAGVGCFIIGYTIINSTTRAQRFRRRPFVLTTLRVGYGFRILISLYEIPFVFTAPLMAMPDVYAGLWSIAIIQEVVGIREGTPEMVFATTILEGLIWNAVLGFFMLLVQGFQLIVRRKPLPLECEHCGYDLRGSASICPECGKAFRETAMPPTPTIN